MKLKFLLPLLLFAVLVVFLTIGLTRDPREIPSPLINKPAPAFHLPQLAAPDKTFALADMQGKVWLLNVWASWCVSCRYEHPVLLDLIKKHSLTLIGFNYKDKPEDAKDWLKEFGDPYQLSVVDEEGRVGIDFGVYGVPETFLIDKNGMIRHKVIGPVTEEVFNKELGPLIQELEHEG